MYGFGRFLLVAPQNLAKTLLYIVNLTIFAQQQGCWVYFSMLIYLFPLYLPLPLEGEQIYRVKTKWIYYIYTLSTPGAWKKQQKLDESPPSLAHAREGLVNFFRETGCR